MSQALFDIVYPRHQTYLDDKNGEIDPDEKIKIFEKYRESLNEAREHHFAEFTDLLDKQVERGYLVFEEPPVPREGLFTIEKLEEDLTLKRAYVCPSPIPWFCLGLTIPFCLSRRCFWLFLRRLPFGALSTISTMPCRQHKRFNKV